MTDPKPNFGSDVRPSQNQAMPYVERRGIEAAAWTVSCDNYTAVNATAENLPSGFYACDNGQHGPFFRKLKMSFDDLVRLPDESTDMLLREFVTFWERQNKFLERGLSAKRGILLWGPPGSGKTSAVQVMADHMINTLNGVVVLADVPYITSILLQDFRRIEPERPLIVVYEDIDALVERYGESEFLSMLDGEHQISNVVNVATTNYPERLDNRFADRPGRFDRVQYVGMPNEDARRKYLSEKAGDADEVTLARWVKESEGWSIAHLRELIVSHEVLGEESADIIDRLNGMQDAPNSERQPGSQKVGFA